MEPQLDKQTVGSTVTPTKSPTPLALLLKATPRSKYLLVALLVIMPVLGFFLGVQQQPQEAVTVNVPVSTSEENEKELEAELAVLQQQIQEVQVFHLASSSSIFGAEIDDLTPDQRKEVFGQQFTNLLTFEPYKKTFTKWETHVSFVRVGNRSDVEIALSGNVRLFLNELYGRYMLQFTPDEASRKKLPLILENSQAGLSNSFVLAGGSDFNLVSTLCVDFNCPTIPSSELTNGFSREFKMEIIPTSINLVVKRADSDAGLGDSIEVATYRIVKE